MENNEKIQVKNRDLLVDFVCVLLLFLSLQTVGFAQRTYTVNSVEDFEDVDLSDKKCADKNGNCTLRAAIQNANTSRLRDKIVFDLEDKNSKRIILQRYLPAIIYPIEIYGTRSKEKVNPRSGVVLDGIMVKFILEKHRDIPETRTGFLLGEKSSGSVINGFIFQSMLIAIKIDSHNSLIQNNIFGSLEKDPKKGNGVGVSIWGNNNLIGGKLENEINYFFGNQTGLSCTTGISNKVVGNIFGFDDEKGQISGNIYGIWLGYPSKDNLIFGNLIAGSTTGLGIEGVGNQVFQNKIGTDYQGTKSIGNKVGIAVNTFSYSITIGSIDQGNLISGNEVGILIDSKNRTSETFKEVREGFLDIQISGNLIGTDASGKFALGNTHGIVLRNSGGVLIGGVGSKSENIISGNFENGVLIIDSFENLLSGNKIGTDISGNYSIPNEVGVRFNDEEKSGFSDNNVIHGNLISGNKKSGIYIGKEVKKLNIISNIFCGKNSINFTSENLDIGIISTSSIRDICIGGQNNQSKNIFTRHTIGLKTINLLNLKENLFKDNIFSKNQVAINELDSVGVVKDFHPVFIKNYVKVMEKESLEFRMKRFQFDVETIVQLKRAIEELPD